MDSFQGNNFDPQSLHKYGYAQCDPANTTDPSGLMSTGELMVVVGIISGLASALIAGIDSALGGKDTTHIAIDAATGFITGFTIGALAVLIGPLAFAKIAPFVPYLLLLMGGWGAYDSFTHHHVAQGIFRIIVTILSVGLATPAARVRSRLDIRGIG